MTRNGFWFGELCLYTCQVAAIGLDTLTVTSVTEPVTGRHVMSVPQEKEVAA